MPNGLLYNPLFTGGMGLLAAGGPSRFPVGIGQALNQGLLAAQGANLQGTKLDIAQQYQQMQAQQMQAQQQAFQAKQAEAERRQQALQQLGGLLGPEQSQKAQMMLAAGVPAKDVMESFGLLQGPEQDLMNVAPGGTVFDPATGKPVFQAGFKPEAGPGPASYQLVQTADGTYVGVNPKDPSDVRPVPGVVGRPPSGTRLEMGPDGSLVFAQGSGVQDSTLLDRKPKADIQMGAINSAKELGRVRGILDKFDPSYYTLPEELKQKFTGAKAYLGIDVSPEDRKRREEFTSFKADTAKMQAEQIHEIYGAALTETEKVRADQFVVAEGDDPIIAEQKLKSYEKYMRNATARNMYILSNGTVSINDVPLESMPRIIQQRGDELEAELRAQQVPEDQIMMAVRSRLAGEFGLIP